ncbi:MAG: cytochrome P450 [Hyphomicrobiales bacterium]|nr:cytochrome P450 [Hyphomicrobiales bacterium]
MGAGMQLPTLKNLAAAPTLGEDQRQSDTAPPLLKRHPIKALLGAAKAHMRAVSRGRSLPPGSLAEAEQYLLDDPHYLLSLQKIHGPILKAWLHGKVTTCIFGVALGRRFLAENEDKITGATTDFTPLFPHGVLRQMNGEPHREYRRLFIEAFKATDLAASQPAIRDIVDDMLSSLADIAQPASLAEMRETLKHALSAIMFRLLLSIERDWSGYDRMLAVYDRYAPNGTFKTAKPAHHQYFAEMKEILSERASEIRSQKPFPNMLSYLLAADRLDETSIGNLLQMAEAGRYDVMGLWTWLLRMLGTNGDVLERISQDSDETRRAAYCEAVVMEALRLEQSEFLLRRANSDIVFDGFFIPKGSIIRIAIWETHKDPEKFKDPFRFDPTRFLGSVRLSDAYAPFGLDKHRCLGADWIVKLGAIFVERAALKLRWDIISDAAPVNGTFHFEPSPTLAIRFDRV